MTVTRLKSLVASGTLALSLHAAAAPVDLDLPRQPLAAWTMVGRCVTNGTGGMWMRRLTTVRGSGAFIGPALPARPQR